MATTTKNPSSPYVAALAQIPRGSTRTYGEVAALAGKASAARAAGRAVTSVPIESRAPWHRAVRADGAFSIDPERASVQLDRLRKDGARPRASESVARWAKRVDASHVGSWRSRRYLPRDDPRVDAFDPRFVEPFLDETSALARHFAPFDVDS